VIGELLKSHFALFEEKQLKPLLLKDWVKENQEMDISPD
jgi:hypothetical protein